MVSASPIFRTFPTFICVVIASAVVAWAASIHNLDFNVYRAGARAFLGFDGSVQLYDEKLWNIAGDAWLPFTYPPFAVLFFLPYAVIPAEIAGYLHSLLLLVSTLAVVHLIITRAAGLGSFLRERPDWQCAVLPGVIVFLAGFSGPWREGLSFGQVNAVLMAVILADLLDARKFGLPRGLLTGLAAGVKLTPLAFGLYFLAQRDWKALFWMATGFLGSAAVGFGINFQGSVYYWTNAVFSPSRVGTGDDMYNVSLRSFTQHLGLPEYPAAVLWVALSLAAIACGYVAIRRLQESREVLAAIGVAALVMLAISPISWYHHWVWFILLLPALVFPSRSVPRPALHRMRIGAGILYVLFLLSSYALSLVLYGRIQGYGPWWLELLSSIWMVAAAVSAAVITATAARFPPRPHRQDTPLHDVKPALR